MLTNYDKHIPLETIREMQRKEEFGFLNKLIKNGKRVNNSLDPINSKVYVDWQDSDYKKQRIKTDASVKYKESKVTYKVAKKSGFSHPHGKKNYSVELPSINHNQQIIPTNKSTQTSGRKSDYALLKERKQKARIFLKGQEKQRVSADFSKDSNRKYKGISNTHMVSMGKQQKKTNTNTNLRGKIKKKLEQQKEKHKLKPKKSQWVEVDILKMETYFAKLQNSKRNANLLQSTGKMQLKPDPLNFPSKQRIPQFIKQYKPKNKVIDIDQLVARKSFSVLFEGEDSLYFGQTKDNSKHGIGVKVTPSYRFQGQWKDNKKVKGYEITPQGYYKGHFKSNKRNGEGEFYWKNGEEYSGEWIDGMKNGSGMWKSGKGDTYIGHWEKGKVSGYGVHVTNTEQRYEGQFKDFLKHGSGKEEFPNGDYFQGMYINGKPNGYGKYIWKNGIVYKGQFLDGNRSGEGELVVSNYLRLKGNFEDDLPNGYGQIIYSNGNEYKGGFVDGEKEGKGIMNMRTEKKILEGIWKKNKFQYQ